ncbi:MAG: hypothetical protein LBB78_10500 [Spirochaetaceae bacterium]|jgi:hypothetical protein|nr:hypothetical protein [Spirochaetaceae bacterium]
MGRINLITGTASGKIGQFQYQTHGMKCVVRTKQPEGLTNDQAELINKPILLSLSKAYRLWAKYLLTSYPSDWSKPQALWNYYTKCNQPLFDGSAQYEAGYAVVKHGAVIQYQAVYTVRPWEQTAVFQFDEDPGALDAGAVICLVRGLVSGPPEDWVIVRLPITKTPQAVPYWNEEAGSENIGYFLLDRTGKLYAGMTQCSVKGDVPPEYFSPSPAEIAANMLVYEELPRADDFLTIRFSFNTAFMPSWITGKTIRYTALTALEGHPAGTSWTAPYNPGAVFYLPDWTIKATTEPLLSWVVLDGATEKSDTITLRSSQILPPPNFLADLSFAVIQEPIGGGSYSAMLIFYTASALQERFLFFFNVKFTGQGDIGDNMPENPMFYNIDEYPYVWEDGSYLKVTPPYGIVNLVIGNHPNDPAYYFGPVFTVGYEEG